MKTVQDATKPPSGPLTGRRIVVPESRELDLFAAMLEAQGASTLRCPMVAILDLEDKAPALAWLGRLAGGGFDDLILLTGEGLRRLVAIASDAGIETAVIAALGRVTTIVRGPKPVRALREIGLAPGKLAEPPTTEGVIAALAGENLAGRRIGVQLYPGNPNELLLDFLRGKGAVPDAVLPYRYASDAEAGRVRQVIEESCRCEQARGGAARRHGAHPHRRGRPGGRRRGRGDGRQGRDHAGQQFPHEAPGQGDRCSAEWRCKIPKLSLVGSLTRFRAMKTESPNSCVR